MTRPKMRPTFEVVALVAPEEVFERMRRRMARNDCPVSGVVGRKHAELTSRRELRHVFSPILVVEEDRKVPNGLRGRFAPQPGVWMGFMALYGLSGMAAVGAALFGFTQYRLGWPPVALAGVPAAGLFALFVYGGAFIGQGLGAEEMYALRSFLDRCVDDTADRPSERPPPMGEARAPTVTRTSGVRFD